MKQYIHPTAIIEGNVEIGDNVSIGPYCFIKGNIRLGSETNLRSHVVIEGNVTIGENNTFYPFCAIGLEPQDAKYKNEETFVEIGNNNIFRECVTVNRATSKEGRKTSIGSGNLLMATSHVAHDCVIGNNTIIANSVLLAGHVHVEDNVYISGQVCVHQFVTIGRNAFISGDTRVPWDPPPFMITQGPTPDVICANTVGLQRMKFPPAVIEQLKHAHKILYMSRLPMSEALELVEKNNGELFDETKYLLDFIRRSSRGHNGRARDKGRFTPDAQPVRQ